MLIKNLSTRKLILRDSDGNQYVIDSLNEAVLDDALIEDNTFRRWLRWRLRDIYISPFVNIQLDSVPIGSKPTINFLEGTNVTIDVAPTTNTLDVTISAGVDVDWNNLVNKPTVFPLQVRKEGSDIGARPHVNFHAGSNITLTVTDDGANDEVDITIDATGTLSVDWTDVANKPTTFDPSAHQASHQTGGSDPISGNLDATARTTVTQSGTTKGTRRKLNFIPGTNVTLTITDNALNEAVDIQIDVTGGAASASASYVTMVPEAGLSGESVLGSAVIMKGLSANQPATGTPGRMYYITDVGFRRNTRDTGAGWDDLIVDWNYVGSKPTTFTPSTHASSHQSGGGDPIKLDDLAAPDDNTDLNVSTSKHGLIPKLPAVSNQFLNGVGTWVTIQESDLTFTDITTNNVSTTKHGYTPKLPNDSTKFLNGVGAWAVPSGTGGLPAPPPDATKFLNGAATPAYAQVKDSDLGFTDIATNNASTSAHGFLRKLDGLTTTFLRGDGTWAAPASSVTSSFARLSADVALTTVDTWVNLTTTNITCAAGTWLLIGQTTFNLTTAGDDVAARILDSLGNIYAVSIGSPAGQWITLNSFAIVTPSGSTTYRLGAICHRTNGATVTTDSSAHSWTGTSDQYSTHLAAIKLA